MICCWIECLCAFKCSWLTSGSLFLSVCQIVQLCQVGEHLQNSFYIVCCGLHGDPPNHLPVLVSSWMSCLFVYAEMSYCVCVSLVSFQVAERSRLRGCQTGPWSLQCMFGKDNCIWGTGGTLYSCHYRRFRKVCVIILIQRRSVRNFEWKYDTT